MESSLTFRVFLHCDSVQVDIDPHGLSRAVRVLLHDDRKPAARRGKGSLEVALLAGSLSPGAVGCGEGEGLMASQSGRPFVGSGGMELVHLENELRGDIVEPPVRFDRCWPCGRRAGRRSLTARRQTRRCPFVLMLTVIWRVRLRGLELHAAGVSGKHYRRASDHHVGRPVPCSTTVTSISFESSETT